MAGKFCPFSKEKEPCSENCQLYIHNRLYGDGCAFLLTVNRLIDISHTIGKIIQLGSKS